jgi:hypothetical protein
MITMKRSPIRRSRPCWLATNVNLLARDQAGRRIQIALALYLLPALLVVLVIGVVGIMLLAVSRLFLGFAPKPIT